jgi:hypothetical protein
MTIVFPFLVHLVYGPEIHLVYGSFLSEGCDEGVSTCLCGKGTKYYAYVSTLVKSEAQMCMMQ